MYTKLFSHITESTIWHEEDPVRLVWITLLAMCDREGFVHSSILGVASRARVTQDKTSEAITKFLGPDPLSMSKDYEGRRIEEVEGGWRLLNYAKYRDIKTAEERREYMRNWMREKRGKQKSVSKYVSKVDKSLTRVNNVSLSDTDTSSVLRNIKGKVSATRIPESFIPTEAHYSLAKELRINCEMEFQKFRDYFLGLSGPKAVKRDWDATLRNWFRNSLNYGGRNVNKPETFGQQSVGNSRRAAAAVLARSGIPSAVGPALNVQPGTDRAGLRAMAKTPLFLPPESD